jgi:DNA-binding NarL/FixJ family response regulator
MPQPEKPEATQASASRPVRGNRILIVDDGDSVRDIIRIFLEMKGFEVCGEAADGVEGIEKAGTTKPDLVILDLAMPRMNGVEAAAVLSRTMPDLPIVLLTMYENFLGSSLTLAGVTEVVSKTDGMDKLVACVHRLLQPARKMPDASA